MKKKKRNNFSNYIDYLKDNPKGYWFKRKLYGWGWIPARWEGWLTVLIFVIALVFVIQEIATNPASRTVYWTTFVLLIILLILIGYKKGEKPGWRWGFSRKKN